ncbi:MAG TPA: hypothetical protein VHR15_15005, partial [Ktedonobacterales bacterium]|nr:hypothetical protein [Ktedonobacterales bacterium]
MRVQQSERTAPLAPAERAGHGNGRSLQHGITGHRRFRLGGYISLGEAPASRRSNSRMASAQPR